jgi:hypothetical protein
LTNGINESHGAVNIVNGALRGATGTRGRPGRARGLIRGGFNGSGRMPAAGGDSGAGGAGRGNPRCRGSGGSNGTMMRMATRERMVTL